MKGKGTSILSRVDTPPIKQWSAVFSSFRAAATRAAPLAARLAATTLGTVAYPDGKHPHKSGRGKASGESQQCIGRDLQQLQERTKSVIPPCTACDSGENGERERLTEGRGV